MFLKLLERHVRRGTLTVSMPDGTRHVFGEGQPSAVWNIRRARAVTRIALNPGANLGETYMAEDWDVEDGGLHALLKILRVNLEQEVAAGRGIRVLQALATLVASWNNARASLSNVSRHYDLDEALFRAFLDQDMHYSCAYFREPGTTLEAAQAAKCDHIARKLCLRPGQRVLDIGSGWGSLAMRLAERHDIAAVGLTLSQEQLRVAQAAAQERSLAGRTEFHLLDYRRHRGQYDRVVSVGMFEHVGRRNFRRFFNAVRDCLAADGIALVHTIGQSSSPTPTNAWIRRHIFPGGYIPAASEVLGAIERSGLVLCDLEVWRRHYALTLLEWNRRFQAARDALRSTRGERFCRMWEFYLVACATAFEVADLVVFQLQLAHRNDAVPLTRDYLHPAAAVGAAAARQVDGAPPEQPGTGA